LCSGRGVTLGGRSRVGRVGWRGARNVARCEGRGKVRGTWQGAWDVARGSGSNDENDTLSSAWQPCVQCIHLFKEHRRFPEVFSHDASSMWCDDLQA